MVNGSLTYNRECVYTNRIFVVAEGPNLSNYVLMLLVGEIQFGNLSFMKRLLLDGFLGDEPRSVGIALAG
jgi:hypothetical protein